MRRAERRRRTQKVAENRIKVRRRTHSWFAWATRTDTEQPGKFRKRSSLGCTCSNHSGMCHARKDSDTARVIRRQEEKIIDGEMYDLE